MTKYRVTVSYDEGTESPRSWDNMGVLALLERNRLCGDKDADPRDITEDAMHILPVYKYEHGGVKYNTGGFSCPWDSGQVGYIYTTPKRLEAMCGKSIPSDERIIDILNSEVKVFSDWANGECYRFTVERCEHCDHCDKTTWEYVDSCGGFIGDNHDDNGILEYLSADARKAVKNAMPYGGTGSVEYECNEEPSVAS